MKKHIVLIVFLLPALVRGQSEAFQQSDSMVPSSWVRIPSGTTEILRRSYISRPIDRGETWVVKSVPSANLMDISFGDSLTGFAIVLTENLIPSIRYELPSMEKVTI